MRFVFFRSFTLVCFFRASGELGSSETFGDVCIQFLLRFDFLLQEKIRKRINYHGFDKHPK